MSPRLFSSAITDMTSLTSRLLIGFFAAGLVLMLLATVIGKSILPLALPSRQLSYLSQISSPSGDYVETQIYLMDVNRGLITIMDRLANEWALPGNGHGLLWWSPDGQSLAFLTNVFDASFRQRWRQFHVWTLGDNRFASQDTTVRTDEPGGSSQIAWEVLDWSPDSRTIAYTIGTSSDPKRPFNLNLGLVLDPAVSPGITALMNSTNDEFNGLWSPDGTHFAYLSTRSNNEGVNLDYARLYLQAADSPVVSRLPLTPPELSVINPRWSPDSTWIAFSGAKIDQPDPNVYIYRINIHQPNAEPERLTQPPAGLPVEGGAGVNYGNYVPVWSPDGTKLAYLVNDGGEINLSVLYLLTRESRILTNTRRFGDITSPSWSPDGQTIAFNGVEVSYSASNAAISSSISFSANLYLVNAGGTSMRRLTGEPEDEMSPVWRPVR